MAKNTKFGNYTPPSYSRMTMEDAPTKKKEPIVSEKEFKEFNKSGDKTLRDFMNARKYSNAEGKFVERAKPLTRKKDTASPLLPNDTDASRIAKQINISEDSEAKGNDGPYGSSKKKKDPIISKAELDKSGFTNLRDFMNAKKYDEATGKFVNRAKALTRRDGKPANAVVSPTTANPKDYKKGGSVKSSASKRGDGIAQRGKTRA